MKPEDRRPDPLHYDGSRRHDNQRRGFPKRLSDFVQRGPWQTRASPEAPIKHQDPGEQTCRRDGPSSDHHCHGDLFGIRCRDLAECQYQCQSTQREGNVLNSQGQPCVLSPLTDIPKQVRRQQAVGSSVLSTRAQPRRSPRRSGWQSRWSARKVALSRPWTRRRRLRGVSQRLV